MHFKKDKFSSESDEALMLHIDAGESKAFDELYKRYGKRLLGYFMRMLNFNKQDAEDALQTVFMKIAESPEKFNGSYPFKTWLFSIASNYCKNIYRHNDVVKKSKEELMYKSCDINNNGIELILSKLNAVEFKKALNDVLNSLSPERREAFILKYQEDKTINEIAIIQNCPEGSVKSRLHYTLKILEEKLQLFNPVY